MNIRDAKHRYQNGSAGNDKMKKEFDQLQSIIAIACDNGRKEIRHEYDSNEYNLNNILALVRLLTTNGFTVSYFPFDCQYDCRRKWHVTISGWAD